MAYNGFAIDEYLDAAAVTRQLDELIKKPVYTIKRISSRHTSGIISAQNVRAPRP